MVNGELRAKARDNEQEMACKVKEILEIIA